MPFITGDFLLNNPAARRLYHDFAEPEPILDYHCHLPPQDIAENRRFADLAEIWLEGDHYKWRAMRANGVDERYCTGDAPPVREVPGLGRHRAAHAAQSALSLDASGTEALLRHRRIAGRAERAAHLGTGQRAAGHAGLARARHPEPVSRDALVHHRRSRGRSSVPSRDSGVGPRNPRISGVSSG